MAEDVSTRFPFINLEKALGRAEQLFQGDRSGRSMPVTVAFELWGYGPKSSGAFQTVGALKAYSLVEDEGANADRKVRLTEAARRYFLDERDEVRAAMLPEFALKPPLFRALWVNDRWSEGIPADTVARSHLKIDRNLNEQSARAVLGIMKDNIRFTGLKSGSHEDQSVEPELPPAPDAPPESGKDATMNALKPTPAIQPPTPIATIGSKPIVFDMESVTVSARFDNVEDLRDFIGKLQKLEPLLPSKRWAEEGSDP